MARRAATSGEKGQRAVVGRRTYGEIAVIINISNSEPPASSLRWRTSHTMHRWPSSSRERFPDRYGRPHGSQAAGGARRRRGAGGDDTGAREQGGGSSLLSVRRRGSRGARRRRQRPLRGAARRHVVRRERRRRREQDGDATVAGEQGVGGGTMGGRSPHSLGRPCASPLGRRRLSLLLAVLTSPTPRARRPTPSHAPCPASSPRTLARSPAALPTRPCSQRRLLPQPLRPRLLPHRHHQPGHAQTPASPRLTATDKPTPTPASPRLAATNKLTRASPLGCRHRHHRRCRGAALILSRSPRLGLQLEQIAVTSARPRARPAGRCSIVGEANGRAAGAGDKEKAWPERRAYSWLLALAKISGMREFLVDLRSQEEPVVADPNGRHGTQIQNKNSHRKHKIICNQDQT
uniref:Uncharacterized protein n=1 Tax=Oryza glumipatula TaxID=40148 RepID=A0A0E0A9R4_9ORYZ